MKKLSKKYAASLKLVDKTKKYTIAEACDLVKKTATAKCDESIDVSFRLNIDPKQADQQLRGTITLPHGNGKTKKILAITDKAEAAKEAGADYVGQQDMLDKISKENWFDFDVIVATPNMMGLLGRMGRVLGPKGLMPNPKTGTVTMECESHSQVHCYVIPNEECIYSPDTCNHPQATVCSGEEAPEPECALWGLTDLCVWSDWCIISE